MISDTNFLYYKLYPLQPYRIWTFGYKRLLTIFSIPTNLMFTNFGQTSIPRNHTKQKCLQNRTLTFGWQIMSTQHNSRKTIINMFQPRTDLTFSSHNVGAEHGLYLCQSDLGVSVIFQFLLLPVGIASLVVTASRLLHSLHTESITSGTGLHSQWHSTASTSQYR